MRSIYLAIATVVLTTFPCLLRAGDGPELRDVPLAASFAEFVSGDQLAAGCQACVPDGGGPPVGWLSETAVRAGGWATDVTGSPSLIGEYQDLGSSAFWDLDHLCTDGLRTDELILTGTDRESMQVDLRHTSPGLRAEFQYERYPHALEHDPLLNFPHATPDPANPGSYLPVSGDFIAEDLNVGEDYAIRVQQLKAKFQGKVTDTVRWRLNVWGLRKTGERQANVLADCFNHPDIPGDTHQCHVLSRRQEIDWLTMELEPGVEGTWGPVTVAYSRRLRSFDQNDQSLTRLYNSYPAILGGQTYPPQLGSENYPAGTEYPYAVVPENLTQTDKLKISIDLSDTRQFYGLLYHGTTENYHRGTQRDFGGCDLRLTDRTIPELTGTAYAKFNYESNQIPATLISGEDLTFDRYDETEVPCTWSDSRAYGGCGCEPVVVPCVVGEDGVPDFIASEALVHPLDYARSAVGLNGRWVPFRAERSWRRGLSFYGGYEYRLIHRDYAVFDATLEPAVVAAYEQADSGSHRVRLAANQRWSRLLNTFVRYKTESNSNPLFGVRGSNGTTNTSLPTHVDRLEIGGTWTPAANLLASATFGFENRAHHSGVADFDEDNYPLTVTLWYAPTCAWSFSGGYAYNTNWIEQAITLGDDFQDEAAYAPATRTWGYGGRAHVWSLGATYAWSRCFRLRGDVNYVCGRNAIDSTVFESPYVWPEIAAVARDVMDSLRLSAGFDCRLDRCTTGYFRYQYLDYDDAVRAYNTGDAHLFLAGLTRRY